MLVTRRALVAATLALPFAGTALSPVFARESTIFAPGGVAISGYDPVAYFTEGRPVPGHAGHALMWRGATWYFATATTREAFEMNPIAYTPQYGGHCAGAMAKGIVAASVPEAFAVYDGRLYLYASTEVRTTWSADIAANVASADATWSAAINP
ncbi:YHS domain protein [Defluviimonas sp. WL0024]|uniref:YHS domain protein n=2 Tax=Albidovulum TaxID=205889 RepID=A0ABT3J9Z2_9RHOB|nr:MULTISPECIES: YHS domain-containing (seleno)protein [Defluviimonas]MCU9847601.1 YHS domain protein [Defluviimonas sp. WL0024]MCW3784513.1 YHS domain protein [Defluviimonas salinarum]